MLKAFQDHFNQLYHKPTLIQQNTLAPLRAGKDVVGLSPTGSGKTVAFLLPLLERLTPGEGAQLLIFEPSQELAIQTAHVAREWSNLVSLKTLPLTGGANIRRQKDHLKKRHPEVIVGTPGRIQVFVNDQRLKLDHLKSVVIDEADNLLHAETLSVVREILNAGPSHVQLTYFSATDRPILHELPKWFGKDAERVDVRKADHTQGPVLHGMMKIQRQNRNKMLKMLLDVHHFQALVFFDNLRALNMTYSFCRHNHLRKVAKLAGYQGQNPRAQAMRGFRQGKYKLLLTTEVASRGLDFPGLPAVINYDLPTTEREYIHRVGRTGRMGKRGLVINFGDNHDFRDLRHSVADQHYHFDWIYFYHKRIMTKAQLKKALPKHHK